MLFIFIKTCFTGVAQALEIDKKIEKDEEYIDMK